MTRDEAVSILTKKDQMHVMKGFDDLSEAQQQALLAQIEALDWDVLALAGKSEVVAKGEISPLESLTLDEI